MTELTQRDQHILDRAYELFSLQDYEKAKEELVRVLDNAPDTPIAHSLLGLCLASQESFDEARKSVRRGVELAPRLAFSHYALANVLGDCDMLNEGLICIREAIRLQPNEVTYYSQMALIYFEQRRWTDAVATATRGLELNSDDIDCRAIRREALSKYESEVGAKIDMTDTLHRITMNAELSADRGWVELCNQNFEEAHRHFSEALLLEPHHPRAQRGMARVLVKRRPLLATIFGFLARVCAHRREGILVSILFIMGAVMHVQKADTMPFGLLWFVPGLLALVPFVGANVFFSVVLKPVLGLRENPA